MKFAFISQHQPTENQHALAAAQGVTLIHIGDTDPFTIRADFVKSHGQFDGVVATNIAAAKRLVPQFVIGVFKNQNRTTSFHIYDLRNSILMPYDYLLGE